MNNAHINAKGLRLVTGAAFLASLALITPSTASAQEFDGVWIGATAGYDSFDSGDSDGTSEDGIAYGIALGYDFNLSVLVVGIEGEVAESSVKASGANVLVNGDSLTLSADRDLYAGFRVGVPVTKTILLYGKGGYSNQRFNAAYTLGNTTERDSDNVDGFRVGAGAEIALGKAFGRLEYRYSEYGSFSDTDLETSRHQVMLTAGARF